MAGEKSPVRHTLFVDGQTRNFWNNGQFNPRNELDYLAKAERKVFFSRNSELQSNWHLKVLIHLLFWC